MTALRAMAVAGSLVAVISAGQVLPMIAGVPLITRTLPPGRQPDGTVWLTFDDGPHPAGTPAVLDLLRQHDARASFFIVGEQAVRHPLLIARIVEDGHELEVHGWNHRCVARTGSGALRSELTATVELITTLTGEHR